MAINDFNLGLVGKLDGTKSKQQLNNDIEALKKQLNNVEITAKLDAKVLGSIQAQLQYLQVQLNDVTVSKSALNGLVSQINSVLQHEIQISNINLGGQTANQAKQTGQQIGKLISDSAEQAISNVSSKNIGRYFRIDSSTSNQFRVEMEKLVSDWTNAKGKLTDLNIQTRTSYDKEAEANITRLHQATVTYKNELDEVIKKTIAWRQIGTTTNAKGEEEILRGFVEVAGQYSKSLDTTAVKTDNFAKKQKETVANLQNTINQITSRAFDSNSSKPITSNASLDKLNTQVAYVENAMYDLRNATSATFDDAKIKVQEEISQLKILEKELRNADNVSTKMKGTDITSGISIAKNDLEKFKADAKDFPQITQTIKDLDTAISKVGDASSLNKFNDDLRVARSELAKIKSETSASNRNEKVGINISGLQSKIADLQKISPEIDKFETEINGAKVTVQSLLTDLNNVNTNSNFSVVNDKWNAFTKAAKSAGIAITEVGTKSESIIDKISNKTYDKQFASLQQTYRNLGLSTDEINQKTEAVSTALGRLKDKKLDTLVQDEKAFADALKKSQNEASILKTDLDKIYNPAKQTRLANDILNWLSKNTAASKKAREQLQLYYEQLSNGSRVSVANLEKIEQEWKKIDAEQRGLGKLGKNLKDQLSQAKDSFVQWISVSSAVMALVYQMKKIPQEVYKIDTSMTNLYKVTDETQAKYEQFLDSSKSKAQKLGRSISGLVDQTANWAKLGYNIDEASKLAETSSVYANVGEVDDETAVSDIVTAIKAFNIEASNSIEVVDKLNNLGNKYATSSADLGEGLSKSASALALAGNDINKTLAMLTGGTEITQNSSEMGNSLKVLSMRIRGRFSCLRIRKVYTQCYAL